MVKAVLVIDMQYDIVKGAFAPPEGYRSVIAATQQLVGHARANGWPVLFTQVCYRAGYVDAPKGLPVKEMGVLLQGSPGASIINELTPREDEPVVVKRRTSPFFGTDLDVILHSLSVENLVVVGVASHRAVESAARDAADRGYDVLVVEDACGAPTQAHHDAAMSVVADWFGRVGSLASVVGGSA